MVGVYVWYMCGICVVYVCVCGMCGEVCVWHIYVCGLCVCHPDHQQHLGEANGPGPQSLYPPSDPFCPLCAQMVP